MRALCQPRRLSTHGRVSAENAGLWATGTKVARARRGPLPARDVRRTSDGPAVDRICELFDVCAHGDLLRWLRVPWWDFSSEECASRAQIHPRSAEGRSARFSSAPRAQRVRRRPGQLEPLDRNVDRAEVVGLHDDAPGLADPPGRDLDELHPERARRPRAPASRCRRATRDRAIRAPLRRRASRRRRMPRARADRHATQSSPSGRIQPRSSPSSRRCGVQSAGITRSRYRVRSGESLGRARRGPADFESDLGEWPHRSSEARTQRCGRVSRSRRRRAPGTCRSPRRRAAPP